MPQLEIAKSIARTLAIALTGLAGVAALAADTDGTDGGAGKKSQKHGDDGRCVVLAHGYFSRSGS